MRNRVLFTLSIIGMIRTGPQVGHTIITLDIEMGLSRSAIPPLICRVGLGRV